MVADDGILLRLLGPVELAGSDGDVAVSAPKRRNVLALLALELNRVVPVDRLVDEIWDGEPPPRARTAVQGHISALRKMLHPRLQLLTKDPGYLLQAEPATVDAYRFAELVAAGTADTDDEHAAAVLAEALALWRGPALADVTAAQVLAGVPRWWAESRLDALVALAERLLRLGRGGEALGRLTALAQAYPLRESVIRLTMLSLYADGRQAEALDLYDRTRRQLADELGVDPDPGLVAAYETILRAEPLATAAGNATTPAAPAAAAPSPTPAQLPRTATGLTGRDDELSWLDRHAAADGIALVVGPAGVGKTAAVVAWAHRAAPGFPDGQLFVDLRGFDETIPVDPDAALAGFLHALDVTPSRVPVNVEEKAALYRSLLADRRMLVILDNARAAAQVRPLLPAAPGCATVITSRQSLAGLIVQEDAAALRLEALAPHHAATLLRQMIGPERADADPAATDRLARLCDHLPLALRVAGARLAAHPGQAIDALVTELADEQDRLAVLATEDADTSVEAALTLSYRTLPPPAGRLFQLLGLHPGTTIDLPTASALAGTDHAGTRQSLKTLTAAHLVTERTPGRYARHDLIRLYTRHLARQLDPAETRDARGRLLDHYYETADSYARILAGQVTPPTGHDPAEPVTWVRAEAETIRALVRDAAGHHEHRRTWRLAYSATFLYGLCHDGAPWWDTLRLGVDAATADGDDEGLVNMLRRLAFEEELAGDLDASIEHTAAAIDRAHGSSVALLRIDLARRLAVRGRTGQALDRLAEAQDGADEETQPARQASLHNGIAWVLLLCDQPERALVPARRALELVGDQAVYPLHASAAHTYARALEKLGRFDEALAAYRQAAGWAGQLGNPRRQAFNAADLGRLLVRLGRAAEARPELEYALRVYSRLGLPEADELGDELARLDPGVPAGPGATAKHPNRAREDVENRPTARSVR